MIDYAERLFKLKCLEYQKDSLEGSIDSWKKRLSCECEKQIYRDHHQTRKTIDYYRERIKADSIELSGLRGKISGLLLNPSVVKN